MERFANTNVAFDNVFKVEIVDGSKMVLSGPIVDRLALYESLFTVDRATELAQAEMERRLLVLPCKAGDTVWAEGWKHGEYEEAEVYRVTYDFSEKLFYVRYKPSSPDTSWVKLAGGLRSGKFGQTVFLTRAEAEAALKCG